MEPYEWYKKGQDIRPFTLEAWNQLGGNKSGWVRMSDADQNAYKAAEVYPDWQKNSNDVQTPIEDQLFKEVDTFAELASLPTDKKFFVHVKSDESPGNIGTMAGGVNPSTYYIYYPETGFVQQASYAG